MKYKALALVILALMVSACNVTPPPAPNVQLSDIFTTPAKQGENSTVSMTIANTGSAPDILLQAQSNVAATSVEIRNGANVITTGIPIPTGGQVKLDPNGYHIVLVGATRNLAPSETVSLSLFFASSGQRIVTAVVGP